MFKNLIKSKLNIKKGTNLLVIEYRKWSFKLPIYLIIFYILYFIYLAGLYNQKYS